MSYPKTLEELKEFRIEGLRSECRRAIYTGFERNGYRYECHETDQLNYNSMLALTNPDGSDTVSCDVTEISSGDGVTLQLTHADVVAVGQLAAAHVYGIRTRYKTAKAAVLAAADEAALKAVTF